MASPVIHRSMASHASPQDSRAAPFPEDAPAARSPGRPEDAAVDRRGRSPLAASRHGAAGPAPGHSGASPPAAQIEPVVFFCMGSRPYRRLIVIRWRENLSSGEKRAGSSVSAVPRRRHIPGCAERVSVPLGDTFFSVYWRLPSCRVSHRAPAADHTPLPHSTSDACLSLIHI